MRKGEILTMSAFHLRMVLTVFLTCIQVKEKVVGKTDSVRFVNLCNFNTLFT